VVQFTGFDRETNVSSRPAIRHHVLAALF